jgi:hypothetical protein
MFGVVGSFNPKFYKSIVKQRLIKSVGFLIVFIMIFTAVLSLKYTTDVKSTIPFVVEWINENFDYFVDELPLIEIENGKLLLPQSTYTKEWQEEFVFIIEPDEQQVLSTVDQYDNGIFITQSKVLIKQTETNVPKTRLETYDMKNIRYLKVIPTEAGLSVVVENSEFDITQPAIERFIEKASILLFPLIFLWSMLIYSMSKPLQILFYSIFSLLFKTHLKVSLTYKELLNVGIYALVPPTTMAVLKDLIGLRLPLFWVLFTAVYCMYLFQGIKATKIEQWNESV